jgi:hypothetical protein
LKYNIANIRCDCGQYTRTFSLGTLNCMDVLYYPSPLASGNITHPCNSRYCGKIFYLFLNLYLNTCIGKVDILHTFFPLDCSMRSLRLWASSSSLCGSCCIIMPSPILYKKHEAELVLSRYCGKIFLYIDHNHVEYLYNILSSRRIFLGDFRIFKVYFQ